MSSVGNKKTTKNMYVVSRYFKNGKNVSKISFSFKVDRKGFSSWVAKECSIRVIKILKRWERSDGQICWNGKTLGIT